MPSPKAITELSNASTLVGGEEIALVQSGDTVKAPLYDATSTVADVKTLIDPALTFIAQLTIDTLDVLTLNSTPIDFIAAPGSGLAIEIVSATAELQFNTAAYAANGIIELITDTATDAQFAMANTSFLFGTVSKIMKFDINNPAAVTDTQIIENQEVHVQVQTGDPTTGDSDLVIRAYYRIISV